MGIESLIELRVCTCYAQVLHKSNRRSRIVHCSGNRPCRSALSFIFKEREDKRLVLLQSIRHFARKHLMD